MDKAAKQYRFSKELEKRKEEMLEFIRERESKENENGYLNFFNGENEKHIKIIAKHIDA